MYSTTSRYADIQKQTASKERLMVLLFEAALRHIRAGATGLEENRFQEAANCLTKASDIIVELHSTLDRGKAPELCDQLAEIYRFVSLRLVIATSTRNAAKAREAERALAPVVDGFRTAVASLSQNE